MKLVDLAVIGAGLAGCSVLARLNLLGFQGSLALLEAGRGPGGRTATRRRRGQPTWRLDHGAPGFNLSTPGNPSLASVLAPLRSSGILRHEWGVFMGLDHRGQLVEVPNEKQLEGEWLRGHPTMASVCEGLLEQAAPHLQRVYGCRIRWLGKTSEGWDLKDEEGAVVLKTKRLVLSGPCSPTPVPGDVGLAGHTSERGCPGDVDPLFDEVLKVLSNSTASVRWNLMLEIKSQGSEDYPRQIWLKAKARSAGGLNVLCSEASSLRLGSCDPWTG